MKKRLLTLACVLAALAADAQTPVPSAYPPDPPPAPYTKQTVSQTTLRLLLSHYRQTGRHSAVTGGDGTEELTVQAQELALTYAPDSAQTLVANVGVDAITSASTDRIDYVLSSASRVDYRAHGNVGYRRRLAADPRVTVSGQSGFSLESDYFSLPVGAAVTHRSPDGSRELTLGVQAFFDDLRWGRVNPGYYRPVKLIYPVELRTQEWYSTYRRTSLNVTGAWQQVINRKLQLALYPEVAYQQGLLATPFHRVYFADDARTVRVENLPGTRWKLPVGAQLHWFATGRVVVRSYYRWYWDSFGLTGHTAQLETPVRLSPFLTVAPLVRLYQQSAVRYFEPFSGHSPEATFYTSDYDLSAFTSLNLALSLRYAPHLERPGRFGFQAFDVRYSHYRRSDGLAAHNLSLVVEVLRNRPRPAAN